MLPSVWFCRLKCLVTWVGYLYLCWYWTSVGITWASDCEDFWFFCFVSPLYWVWLQASQQRRSTMLGEWQVILCLIVNTSPVFSFLTGPVSSPCCWHLCRIWNFQQQHPAEHEVWWAWGAFSLAIAIPFCNEWRLRQHILHLVKRVSRVPLESPPRWPSG